MVVGAVQQLRRAREALPVDHFSERTLRVFRRRRLGSRRLHARRQQFKLREAPVDQRQIGDGLFVERDRHVGALGFQQRRLRSDLDHLGNVADFELQIGARFLVYRNNHRLHGGLESGGFDAHLIRARDQSPLREVAIAVGRSRDGDLPLRVGDRHLRVCDRRARLVNHCADDVAVDRLPESSRPEQRKRGEKNYRHSLSHN